MNFTSIPSLFLIFALLSDICLSALFPYKAFKEPNNGSSETIVTRKNSRFIDLLNIFSKSKVNNSAAQAPAQSSEISIDYYENMSDSQLQAVKLKISEFSKFDRDIIICIAKFLHVPTRELISLNKHIANILKNYIPFRFIVSERFNIPELKDAIRDDDLIWFENMDQVYKNDSEYFYFILFDAIIKLDRFPHNQKYLCRYFLRAYHEFNLIEYSNLVEPVIALMLKDQDYDGLIPFLVNHHQSLLFDLVIRPHTLSNINVPHRLSVKFYVKLFSYAYEQEKVEYLIDIIKKSNDMDTLCKMLSKTFFSDYAWHYLIKVLSSFENLQTRTYVFKNALRFFFTEDLKYFSDLHKLDLDKIYNRNLKIARSSLIFLDITESIFEQNNILNTIYFGPEEDLTSEFLEKNYLLYKNHLFYSALNRNRLQLIEELISKGFFIEIYMDRFELFSKNLPIFFKYYQRYPHPFYFDEQKVISTQIFKYYGINSFKKVGKGLFVSLKLKPAYKDNNDLNLPTNFDELYTSFDILVKPLIASYYSGTDETLIFDLFDGFRCDCRKHEIIYDCSDNFLKIFFASPRLMNMKFPVDNTPFIKVKINVAQLLRLIRNRMVSPLILKKSIFLIEYDINDLDLNSFKSDSEFEMASILLQKSIFLLVLGNLEKNEIFSESQQFFKIRKALRYIIEKDFNFSLVTIPKIMDLLEQDQLLKDCLLKKNQLEMIKRQQK